MRVGEGMRAFGAMKRVLSGRSVNVRVKRELYERVVVPTIISPLKILSESGEAI